MSAERLRIAALRWEPYALPFAQPFVTATGQLRERRGFVLRVQSAEGTWGVGEAAPLPDYGGESLPACEATLREWERTLPGSEVASDAPPLHLPPALGLVADAATAPTAVHALEQALLDLLAQRAGLPLAYWLHPRACDAVALNATLGASSPEAAAEAARTAVAQGYGTLKLKVGVDDAADEARILAVREAVGAGPRLRIDANGAWQREQAEALLRHWAALGLEYVEQPLPPDDAAGLAWLAARSPVPVAADESIRTAADAERLLTARAAAVLVLKPMLLGGPLTTLRVARRAMDVGVPVVVTTVLEGIYGRLAALHTAAAVQALHREAGLPGAPPACGLATGALLTRDLVADPPAPEGGAWRLPAAPGLGLA